MPSQLCMDIYKIQGFEIEEYPNAAESRILNLRTGVPVEGTTSSWLYGDPFGREAANQLAWGKMPQYDTDMNAAITLWDGKTTWGYISIITNQVTKEIYYRACTSGIGKDDGLDQEAWGFNPAAAIAMSYLAHMKAKASNNV